MENQIYLSNLIEQYMAATGLHDIDINSNEFMREFVEWMHKRLVSGETFLSLLEEKGICIDNPCYAEVGKGRYDSLVTPYDTTIITPYANSFENFHRAGDGKLISSQFDVIGGVPTLINNDNIIPRIEYIKPSQTQFFVTHNPYSSVSINKWMQLHNNRNYGIIFGVYGKTYDVDKEKKIKQLNKLKSMLEATTIISEQVTVANGYYAFVATDMTKKRIKK